MCCVPDQVQEAAESQSAGDRYCGAGESHHPGDMPTFAGCVL